MNATWARWIPVEPIDVSLVIIADLPEITYYLDRDAMIRERPADTIAVRKRDKQWFILDMQAEHATEL